MSELWDLVWGKPSIDPGDLARAIERESARDDLDIRTRLLIRDGAAALENYWGRTRAGDALRGARQRLTAIRAQNLGPVKFLTIRERLMEHTKPEAVQQFLRDLGGRLARETELVIGGAIALILQGHLSRATDDIDVVDEVPEAIRNEHALLDQLRCRYGLALTHFQSHFLPRGWEQHLHTFGSFGRLQVAVVDMYDLFLGKLFSARDKDLDDLRLLLPQVDREVLLRRLRDDCDSFLSDEALRSHAVRNWYILTGEALPAAAS